MTGLVFPASAGINRKMLFENAMPRGVPRVSGLDSGFSTLSTCRDTVEPSAACTLPNPLFSRPTTALPERSTRRGVTS